MKKINFLGNCTRLLKAGFIAAAAVFGMASCEQYDLDERLPEWLGSSIYDYLDENGYDTYVKLIDDLGYHDVMSMTGSKTVFVADEDAVQRFFKSGTFKKPDGSPVKSYNDLSLAQKKMLLYGSMLNNVYQVAMLSSSEGPVEGDCMRRISSTSIYDTVQYITPSIMPNNKFWQYYRSNDKSLRILRDATLRPMVFFVNDFLKAKKITDDDYDFLFNQGAYGSAPGRQSKDASVNGVTMVIDKQNIKCFNGFVHVMKDVIYPLPNMAEYLSINRETSIYSSLLERFCAPYYNEVATQEFNRLYPNAQVDSVFEVRYFSKRSQGENGISITPDKGPVPAKLKFDPGWNEYYASASNNTTASVALQQNMGVMLVPDDAALMYWWNEGGGLPLKGRYGIGATQEERLARKVTDPKEVIEDMAGVPDNVIVKLLNNNMLSNFTGSVPSKFENVLDDANDMMGITPASVDSVKMCCNGAIYFTNYVFSPTAYRSVSFPALVNESLQIIYWAIEQYEFDAYLNSMVATYSFFIPSVVTDPADPFFGKLVLLDDVSGGNKYSQALVFRYDDKATSEAAKVKADFYAYDPLTGTIGDKVSSADEKIIQDRLTDLLDYHIIIGNVEDGYEYYQTKGRGTVKFEKQGDKMYVWGGYQLEQDQPIEITQVYDMTSSNGNGKTYIMPTPLLTSSNSVCDILSDEINYPEFSTFYEMMESAGCFTETGDQQHKIGSEKNVASFNTYHYTVYVPGNAELNALIESNTVLTAEKIEALNSYFNDLQDDYEDYESCMIKLSRYLRGVEGVDSIPNLPTDSTYQHSTYIAQLKTALKNFVKYHIQDNSVYYGAEFKIDTIHSTSREANYETAYMNELSQFEKLAVSSNSQGISIRDAEGNTRHVMINKPGYYNIMCREYEYNDKSSPSELETSSYAVIHMIDGPLMNGATFNVPEWLKDKF